MMGDTSEKRKQISIAILIALVGIGIGYLLFLRPALSERANTGGADASFVVPETSVTPDAKTQAATKTALSGGDLESVVVAAAQGVSVRSFEENKQGAEVSVTGSTQDILDFVADLADNVRFRGEGQISASGPQVVVSGLRITDSGVSTANMQVSFVE